MIILVTEVSINLSFEWVKMEVQPAHAWFRKMKIGFEQWIMDWVANLEKWLKKLGTNWHRNVVNWSNLDRKTRPQMGVSTVECHWTIGVVSTQILYSLPILGSKTEDQGKE